MRTVTVIILFAFILYTYAKETPPSPTVEVQNAKPDNPLLDRRQAWPNQDAELDASLLGKAGHLTNPPQSLVIPQVQPATQYKVPFLSASRNMPVVQRPVLAQYQSTKMHNLPPCPGNDRKKRVGRGHASGHGGSCGRGMKGHKAHSGPGVRTGFEGGQTPLWRRLPKLKGIGSGMSAPKELWFGLHLGALQSYIDGGHLDASQPITTKLLRDKGFVARKYSGVKLLGMGKLTSKVALELEFASAFALVKLENGGSTLRIIPKEKVGPRPAKSNAKGGR